MRIAHVTDFYLPRLGGIELHVADLAERQRAQGHVVDVLTSSPGPAESHVTRLGPFAGLAQPLSALAVRAGVRVLQASGVDVVHAHVGVGSPLAFFLARATARLGIPTVVTVHSLWNGVHPVMSAADAWGHWCRLPIVWTAVSEAAAEPVRRLLPGQDVRVVPNGIDQEGWRPAEHTPEGTGPVTAVAVMRLSLRKRPIPLLRMLRRANAVLPADAPLHLVVAGDGPMRTVMRLYAARHGMSRRVTLLGRLDRAGVARAFSTASLFVAPARLESFGIAALEARCAGLPVVAMASGGVREFVSDGTEGVLCADDDDMVRALVRLAHDRALRERMAAHNASSDTRIAWPSVLEATCGAYRDAVALQPTAVAPVRLSP